MNPDIFFLILYFVLIVLSRVLHEWGHYRRAKVLGANPRFSAKLFTLSISYDEKNKLSVKDEISVLFSGVVLGLLPLFVILALGYSTFMVLVAWLLYFWACVYDIKRVMVLWTIQG